MSKASTESSCGFLNYVVKRLRRAGLPSQSSTWTSIMRTGSPGNSGLP